MPNVGSNSFLGNDELNTLFPHTREVPSKSNFWLIEWWARTRLERHTDNIKNERVELNICPVIDCTLEGLFSNNMAGGNLTEGKWLLVAAINAKGFNNTPSVEQQKPKLLHYLMMVQHALLYLAAHYICCCNHPCFSWALVESEAKSEWVRQRQV